MYIKKKTIAQKIRENVAVDQKSSYVIYECPQGPPQSGGPIREASQTVTEKTLVTPGSPMESLRRRHMTNQTYRQPGGVAGGTLPMRSPANPNKPVPGPNVVGHSVIVDPKSPAGSLGQLISKCPFGVFKSPKKTNEFFFQYFCPRL